jgi:predicted Zn-dependent peptidase
MWDPYADFEKEVLPNGLTIYAAHWPNRPWEIMGFLVHGGASHDPPGLEGLAHFVEHMISQNAPLSKKELVSFFEDCGGKVNLGSADFLSVQYSFFLPQDESLLAKALSLFGNMLLPAKLNNNIERERQVVLREFSQRYPFPWRFELEAEERRQVFSGLWLERMICVLGFPDPIRKIAAPDLQVCYDTFYVPKNISVVAVGGEKIKKLAKLLSESPFGQDKKGERTPPWKVVHSIARPKENLRIVEMSSLISTLIEAGAYRSVAAIPAIFSNQTIKILAEMLDVVLLEEAREKRGWAYSIESSFNNLQQVYGFLIESGGLSRPTLEKIEQLVNSSLASLNERRDLFEQIKKSFLNHYKLPDLSGRGLCNEVFDDLVRYGRIISLEEYLDKIAMVEFDDVRKALQWLQPEHRWTLIMKP